MKKTQLDKFNVYVMHRRAGKTLFCLNTLTDLILSSELSKFKAAYIAYDKSYAKRVVWNKLKKELSFIDGIKFDETKSKINFKTKNGTKATIYISGAEEINKFKDSHFNVLILDEVDLMKNLILSEELLNTIVAKDGKVIFIGTPRGKNLLYSLYKKGENSEKGWKSTLLPVTESGKFDQEEINFLLSEINIDLFNQEFMCNFA